MHKATLVVSDVECVCRLEDWKFDPRGSLRVIGRAYGHQDVADGTVINTWGCVNLIYGDRLVRTQAGLWYELGKRLNKADRPL